jgi:multidrug resistance efflux pump
VLVREGDRVPTGTALVALEPADWPSQLAEAEGALGRAKATLEKLERGARPEELEAAHARALETAAALAEAKAGPRREVIAGARARLAAEEAAVEKARADDERLRRVALENAGAVSKADLDAAAAALRGAVATRDALAEALAELEHGTRREEVDQAEARALDASAEERLLRAGTRAEDVAAARADVAAAEGKVAQIQTMLDELTIRAPRGARVEACDLRPGDILGPNATAATLLEDAELYVRIYIPETEIGRIAVGQEVPIVVDSFPGRSFAGVVERINEVGEYSPRNLQTADERADQVFGARVIIRAGRGDLRAGMAAFVRVPKSGPPAVEPAGAR